MTGYEVWTNHQDNEVELLSHRSGSAKELPKNLLTFRKLTTTAEVGTVERHDTVDNEETVFVGGKVGCEAFQQFGLHLE
jgi:hypothetical protein